MMNFFSGRRLVIATKHKKESVIAPRAVAKLGVLPFVPSNFDTDRLGTFTGEIDRSNDPLTTARKKCEWAMKHTGVDLAISSEGSFGPHPLFPFIFCNEEIVMLLDKKHQLEITEKIISTKTNFNGQLCSTETELMCFANSVLFPSHGLILRDAKDSAKQIFKGITAQDQLLESFRLIVKQYGHAFVETDMRALYNPTRMEIISEATDALVQKTSTTCKKCNTPGFGITNIKKGLRCSQCGLPTQTTAYYIHSCPKCKYTVEQPNPHKSFENPMYCDYCNP